MQVTSLGYRTDLALLRLGDTEVTDHGDHLVIRSPHNPAHWWGNFLLLDHVPAAADAPLWLDRFAATFPDARHITLGFDGTDGTSADLAAFSALGLHAEAQAVMTARSVHPPRTFDPTATYRTLASDDDWAQSVDLRLRCDSGEHDPIGHRPFVTAKAATNRALVAAGPGQWFGAFVDGLLVAQLGLLAVDGDLARFQSVETDPEYRRRGLAGALVHRASQYGFGELGARTLVMVADPLYFAIDLYRSVGFGVTEAQLQVERAPGRASPVVPEGSDA